MSALDGKMAGSDVLKHGAACVAGNDILPMLSLSVTPKIPLTWLHVVCLWMRRMLGYSISIESVSRKMNVRSGSNPTAAMSRALSIPIAL
eukprot:CAMPEP_0114120650 /NCGR_PEP_ID=MMETSP0043_2-20121206/6766_1 /TAXON_ID=464988 /ORGANISM="Hemiselmis andersenii, Strain CCMP644" /LENGTH=89 /DNA_ID=CAMNT_0001213295 /DNA_START=687 /DNA_END=956 /DNA_ORIENTATION=+